MFTVDRIHYGNLHQQLVTTSRVDYFIPRTHAEHCVSRMLYPPDADERKGRGERYSLAPSVSSTIIEHLRDAPTLHEMNAAGKPPNNWPACV